MKAGWVTLKLGDVCTLQRGFDLPKAKRSAGQYPLVTSSGPTDTHNEHRVHGPGVATGRSGSIGEVFFIERDFWPLNTALYVKDFHGNDERFIFYLLKYFDLARFASGAGVPTLNRNHVHDELVSIPTSLGEQKRIVAVLDEAFAALDRARTHAETNLKNARELFESYLASIFSGQTSDWTMRSFGDNSFIKIVDGDRGANYPKKSDFLSEGHCLFLNTKNVRPDGFSFDATMFITEEKDKALRKGKLERRDVVLTTRGTIGNIALYDGTVEFEDIRINSGMLILRPNEEIITSEYLFELLRSHIVKAQIDDLVSGAAQPQLPIKSLVKFEVPVPKSLTEQTEIVGKLNELSEECASLTNSYTTKLADLDDLRQSLLQKAFAGELT